MGLGTNYKATLEVISPVHIDSGKGDLLADYDFTVGREVYVIDQDKMWEILGESVWNQEGLDARLSNLLKLNQYDTCSRYILNNPGGTTHIPKIKEQIKTAQGELYIPGSSLKGAIRTALAFAMVDSGEITVSKRDLGRNPRFAAQRIESKLFGQNPNSDLFRALHVTDSESVQLKDNLKLYPVSTYSLRGDELRSKGNRFQSYVEALSKETKLNFSIRRDDYLLRPEHQQLKFNRQKDWLKNFVYHCNTFADALISNEIDFYEFYHLSTLQQFYQYLQKKFDQLDEDRECMLNIAWGTGWNPKTIGLTMTDDIFYHVKRQYRLGRKNEDEFPKSRRLIEIGNAPEMPLGWIKVRIEDVND
ncbi:MAG: type III-A CRISPR-associated RAMP protein Csm5 [Candidatus Hodarchaeales archaeon]